jgi:hypothetical protein
MKKVPDEGFILTETSQPNRKAKKRNLQKHKIPQPKGIQNIPNFQFKSRKSLIFLKMCHHEKRGIHFPGKFIFKFHLKDFTAHFFPTT